MTLVAWVVLVKRDQLYVTQHQKQNITHPLQYHVFFKQLNNQNVFEKKNKHCNAEHSYYFYLQTIWSQYH